MDRLRTKPRTTGSGFPVGKPKSILTSQLRSQNCSGQLRSRSNRPKIRPKICFWGPSRRIGPQARAVASNRPPCVLIRRKSRYLHKTICSEIVLRGRAESSFFWLPSSLPFLDRNRWVLYQGRVRPRFEGCVFSNAVTRADWDF